MTKMAAMPIYGKNPSKVIFSETKRLISRKLGVRHRWLKYSNVYINHDPVMTLTKFMARSTWVAYVSELGKLFKCHLKGKAMDRILKILKKENGPRASSAPALELNTIIFKYVYWYMQLISGERLQDHWSSGFIPYAYKNFVSRQGIFALAIMKTSYAIYGVFSSVKIENFIRKKEIFLIYLLKTLIVGTRKNRLAQAILTSTHNLCFSGPGNL